MYRKQYFYVGLAALLFGLTSSHNALAVRGASYTCPTVEEVENNAVFDKNRQEWTLSVGDFEMSPIPANKLPEGTKPLVDFKNLRVPNPGAGNRWAIGCLYTPKNFTQSQLTIGALNLNYSHCEKASKRKTETTAVCTF